MKKFLQLFTICLLLSACPEKKEEAKVENANLTFHTKEGNVKYFVEEAVTHEQLATGLMDRDSLTPGTGMIFDLSNVDGQIAMWMKNTKIPLDMIFVDPTGTVVWVYENAVPYSEELIMPPLGVVSSIEINAGEAAKNHIEVGDTVSHRFFEQGFVSQMAPVVDEPLNDEANIVEDITFEGFDEDDSSETIIIEESMDSTEIPTGDSELTTEPAPAL